MIILKVHTKKRNRLLQSRLNALVFVMYNKRLGEKRALRKQSVDNFTPDDEALAMDGWESDDEWVTGSDHPISTDVDDDIAPPPALEPQPCPDWSDVIRHELDEDAILAEIDELQASGPRRRRKKKKTTTLQGSKRMHLILSSLILIVHIISNLAKWNLIGGCSGKGKGPMLVDEDELLDVDKSGDDSSSVGDSFHAEMEN